jgi:hypothetical protein
VELVFAVPAVGFVVCGQVCFVAMMGCCVAIHPSAVAVKRGLSYYGTHADTIVPYSIGFVLCAVFTALAVSRMQLDAGPVRRLRTGLMVILTLLIGILFTPYSVDLVVDWLHIGLAAFLFVVASSVGIWLALRIVGGLLAHGLLGAQLAGGTLSVASQLGALDYMIPGQLVFQLAFSVLLVRALRDMLGFAPVARAIRQ